MRWKSFAPNAALHLGALPLTSVVASLQAFIAEDVETLGEDSLLYLGYYNRDNVI